MSRRSFPDDVKLRVLKLANAGKSITDICHLTKIPEKAVRSLLREYGVTAAQGSRKHIDVSARAEFIRLHEEEHLTPAEIARQTGYSETSVRKTVKAYLMKKQSDTSTAKDLFSIARETNDLDSIETGVDVLTQDDSCDEQPDLRYDEYDYDDLSESFYSDNIRKLDTIQKQHKLNDVYSYDKPSDGNAHHAYFIHAFGDDPTTEGEHEVFGRIEFQHGPRDNAESRHGVIDSDLLEIVRDRLKCFQSGDFACSENAHALLHVEAALVWLNMRVEDRAERKVLGTNNK